MNLRMAWYKQIRQNLVPGLVAWCLNPALSRTVPVGSSSLAHVLHFYRQAMWMLTPFSVESGATRGILGGHRILAVPAATRKPTLVLHGWHL